jgi:ACT domain-containing protein
MITKILTWIRMNGASVLGSLQLVIKAIKEAATAVVNILSIFMPALAAEKIILKIRSVGEAIDGVIEKIKAWLLAVVM